MAAVTRTGVTKTYRLGPARRAVNRAMAAFVRAGLGPRRTYLLTVAGRTTGRPCTTPVSLVERDGERWLVAPYGEVSWVRNARAAGVVTVRRGRRVEQLVAREVTPDVAAPVLREYVRQEAVVRPFVAAAPTDPVEAFAAIAPRHPVFALAPASA